MLPVIVSIDANNKVPSAAAYIIKTINGCLCHQY